MNDPDRIDLIPRSISGLNQTMHDMVHGTMWCRCGECSTCTRIAAFVAGMQAPGNSLTGERLTDHDQAKNTNPR